MIFYIIQKIFIFVVIANNFRISTNFDLECGSLLIDYKRGASSGELWLLV